MNKELKAIAEKDLWKENPVTRQILGICSALAVTNFMTNTFIMGMGVTFVTAFSSMTVSLLRKVIPRRIRMMVQTLIIASYVIIVDIVLKAYMPEISRNLGPYVGLIITNCIIMGRCEAYGQSNPPGLAFFDGMMSGFGYTIILMFISFIRELMGFGTLFGLPILGEWWTRWTIMVMPASAFFVLAIIIWIVQARQSKEKA
ncbi:MAG TPA: NADH:ubiquinone reductase (Na(+)-transporting) subunit D [Clostridia bacterium]|nr:NADH:ubiquinone reductase (Na(+)-transporting) subunit D [Clostridia bacterium]